MGKPLLALFRRNAVRAAMAAVCIGVVLPSTSAFANDLFSADAPVASSSADARRAAYREALDTVLGRVSGASLSPARAREIFPNPSNMVVRFQPVDRETLRVTFDSDAIERALTAAGERFWGDDRPLTLIWLAVDWGDGKRELLSSSDSASDESLLAAEPDRNQRLREQILSVAELRGIPVLFPLVDTDDLKNVTFSDVWGGFDEAVVVASKRYAVDSILIGRVRGDRFDSARWAHRFGGESMTVSGAPQLALQSVADRLGTVFAIGGRDLVRNVRLSISGVSTMEEYAYLQTMLDGINVIEGHSMHSINGDRIELNVAAHGGADRLARTLVVKGLVREESRNPVVGGESGSALFFFLDR